MELISSSDALLPTYNKLHVNKPTNQPTNQPTNHRSCKQTAAERVGIRSLSCSISFVSHSIQIVRMASRPP